MAVSPENARFAQTINTNITKMFYEYIIFKVKMRENLNLAIKGESQDRISVLAHLTRSGKSTVALSLGNFISSMTRVPYSAYHICANESEYYSKVKNAKFNELYHIDEQKESKEPPDSSGWSDIFGAGSFRSFPDYPSGKLDKEEMGIMDWLAGMPPDPINTKHCRQIVYPFTVDLPLGLHREAG